MTKQEAKTTIIRHLELCNERPEDWLICVSGNVEQFLVAHKIDKIHDLWIAKEMDSADAAKELKNELIEKFHMNSEDKDEEGVCIIGYKRRSSVN